MSKTKRGENGKELLDWAHIMMPAFFLHELLSNYVASSENYSRSCGLGY